MTTSPINNNETNAQMAAAYMAKIQADIAQTEQLLTELEALGKQVGYLKLYIALLETIFSSDSPQVLAQVAKLNAANAQINQIKTTLYQIDAGFKDFSGAIDALIGMEEQSGGSFIGSLAAEDSQMANSLLSQLAKAMGDRLIADKYHDKIKQDGDNNAQMLQDAIQAMNASTAENAVLVSMQGAMGKDLEVLNQQKNDAQTDKDSYRWYDDAISIFTDEQAKEDHDRLTIDNSNKMSASLKALNKAIGSEIASTQNSVYDMAALSLDQLMKEVKKLIMKLMTDPSSAPGVANQVDYLMAIAYGILSTVESDAAQEKAKNQQTDSQASIYATQMNISDQQAALKQLEQDLKYADTMGTIMKVAKPLLEVGGCLLAPGIGSFLVMAAFAIMDQAGLTDKLVSACGGGLKGQMIVGGAEMGTVIVGGGGLDYATSAATDEALAATTEEVAATVSKVIEEAIQTAVSSAEQAGAKANEAAVRETVTAAVNDAVKSAVRKTVQQFSKQAAATLLPQLVKTAAEEGSVSLSKVIAKAAEQNCIIAAEDAAKTAAEKVVVYAEAAAYNGGNFATQSAEVAEQAANEAVANITKSTAEDVAKDTTVYSAGRTAASRATYTGLYNALNDNALTNVTIEIMKKQGKKDSDADFQKIVEIMKVIEGLLSSLVVMFGTGVARSAYMEGSATTLTKMGALSQIAGTGAQGISQGGTADAEFKEADATKTLNTTTVTNDLLHMYLEQLNQQTAIDQKQFDRQMAEQASTYTMELQLSNNSNALISVLSQQAV